MDTRSRNVAGRWPANWTHWANLALAFWLMAAPFILGYDGHVTAAASSCGFGFVLAAIAVSALRHPESWEEGIDLILGLCLSVSPWLFNFTGTRVLTTHAVIVGLGVILLATWSMLRNLPGDHWWQHGPR